MLKNLLTASLVSLGLIASLCAETSHQPLMVEHGRYSIHLLLHAIGTEEYTVHDLGGGNLEMTTTSTLADRGTTRASTSRLTFDERFAPGRFEQKNNAGDESLTEVHGNSVSIEEAGAGRRMSKPPLAYVGFTSTPAAVQMMMMRYWKLHHQPARLPILRVSEKALPVQIRLVGHDAFQVKGRIVRLTRYTVGQVVFGREILWMNDSNRLVALMTFAGGLPQEELLEGYEAVAGELVRSGISQEMLDLDELGRQVPPEMSGDFAIVGARLIDGTGAPVVEHAVVIVRGGRIAAAGPETTVQVPPGMKVLHAEGKSLLPGLWEMHTHYSGVEFGPALLSAGITTARDCGGESEFLTTVRRKIDLQHALGPKLLLAGLIDSGGPLAFGAVDVKSAAEGVAAVDEYADQGFQQIKVYTQIRPDVLKAICAEAHKRGMSVTGHVPKALNAFDGIVDGMDQINHLQFIVRAMSSDGGATTVDLGSDRATAMVVLLKERQIVVDPTAGWAEMAGRPKDVDVASFEPGIRAAPYTLASKYLALGSLLAETAGFTERMATNQKVIRALYEAGVPIVAGSDTGLLGYGLNRELELYVRAGMTPIAAIQAATIVAARAMKLDKESGSIEAGKRADLLLVEGNPLINISDLRRVISVVKDGRLYDSRKLGRSVGFAR